AFDLARHRFHRRAAGAGGRRSLAERNSRRGVEVRTNALDDVAPRDGAGDEAALALGTVDVAIAGVVRRGKTEGPRQSPHPPPRCVRWLRVDLSFSRVPPR